MTVSSITSYITDSSMQKSPLGTEAPHSISASPHHLAKTISPLPVPTYTTASYNTPVSALDSLPSSLRQSPFTVPDSTNMTTQQHESIPLVPYSGGAAAMGLQQHPAPLSGSGSDPLMPFQSMYPGHSHTFPPGSTVSTSQSHLPQISSNQPPFGSGSLIATGSTGSLQRDPNNEILLAEITRLRERLQTLETENTAMSLKLNQQQHEVEHRLAEIEMHFCGSDSVASGSDEHGPEGNKESVIWPRRDTTLQTSENFTTTTVLVLAFNLSLKPSRKFNMLAQKFGKTTMFLLPRENDEHPVTKHCTSCEQRSISENLLLSTRLPSFQKDPTPSFEYTQFNVHKTAWQHSLKHCANDTRQKTFVCVGFHCSFFVFRIGLWSWRKSQFSVKWWPYQALSTCFFLIWTRLMADDNYRSFSSSHAFVQHQWPNSFRGLLICFTSPTTGEFWSKIKLTKYKDVDLHSRSAREKMQRFRGKNNTHWPKLPKNGEVEISQRHKVGLQNKSQAFTCANLVHRWPGGCTIVPFTHKHSDVHCVEHQPRKVSWIFTDVFFSLRLQVPTQYALKTNLLLQCFFVYFDVQ